eukprot:8577392-Lingulodinium_polyedra.AAC.1
MEIDSEMHGGQEAPARPPPPERASAGVATCEVAPGGSHAPGRGGGASGPHPPSVVQSDIRRCCGGGDGSERRQRAFAAPEMARSS